MLRVLLCVALLAGCAPSDEPPDASSPLDAGRVDAAEPPADAAAPDAAAPDAASPDGGVEPPPTPLVDEPFERADLSARGWSRDLERCAPVRDDTLGRDVIECAFEAGTSSPVGGNDSSWFDIPGGLEELTLHFREQVRAGYVLGSTLHGFYGISSLGGSPANSHMTLYFEPSNSGFEGEWALKLQDNQAMNCAHGNTDLFGVTEDRSVGGCQQSMQQDPSVRGWCWGDPCDGGLETYTGQSGWTAQPTEATKVMAVGDWVEVIYYVRLNTPGSFDGLGYLALRFPGEDAFTPVVDSSELMMRTAPNADTRVDHILFGPWASSNRSDFTVRFADFELYEGDARAHLLAR